METLKNTPVGTTVKIEKVNGEGALRRHFLDMGLIPGTEVTVIKYAPMGDPVSLSVRGYELTLRLDDAANIEVSAAGTRHVAGTVRTKEPKKTEHPGLGEGGRFHPRGSGDPLPAGTVLKFALVGNQNSGKTTLFNRLTGSKQHVGNFPGVTVDRKDGPIKGRPDTLVTDLPGIYSMSPYTSEEIVSRSFVLEEKPHAIINIVDATNIERNLYLTMQLLELDIPMVIALNMMDELTANGGSVDINEMEDLLGVPVVPISAAKNSGIEELIDHAIHIAHFQEKPLPRDFCGKDENGGAVHRCLHGIQHLIEDHAEKAGLPVRFAASKAAEGDELMLDQLGLDENELAMIEHIADQTESERGLDRCAAVADMRFTYIEKLCRKTVIKPAESKEHIRSTKIDKVLTGKWTAIPMFILIMGAVFFLTFSVIGKFLQDLLEQGVDALITAADSAFEAAEVNTTLRELIVKGIFGGVGSVLSFLPIIIILFFFLSMLEDSGYVARVAFFMDKILRRFGLSGRSIVPLLIGFGCTVPAVMATRTLPSDRDRKMTVLLTPFMSCSAKLPIYAFFADAFFPEYGWLVMTGLYIFGIIVGILGAVLYKNTLFKGEPVPFVMELPNYRFPGVRNVSQLLWEKAKDFLRRAFSVILVASVIVWFLGYFTLRMDPAADPADSILALAAGIIAPILAPIGLGDWRICVSLVSGFMAKESVVSVLGVLYGEDINNYMTTLTAASILIFSLLYTPCIAAITSVKRELGLKWAVCLVAWQCALAWVFTLIVRAVLMMIGVQ